MPRATRITDRRIYDREQLLAHRNVSDDPTIIASIPEEIRVSKYNKVGTTFNNVSRSCKPEKFDESNRKDDFDSDGSAMIACSV